MQVVIDKFGRMVLPKAIRDDFALCSGDKLDAAEEGGCIVLKPVRDEPALRLKDGVLVYGGRSVGTLESGVSDSREERVRNLAGADASW